LSSLKNNYIKIFTHDLSICDGKDIIHIPPFTPSWIDKSTEAKVYTKSKLISMIASIKNLCEGHKYRQKVANDFPYSDDLYGFGRKDIARKVDGLKDYMFSVCMENSVYDTYYTEKLLDCFLTGTIPIYVGSKTTQDYFDSNGIIYFEGDEDLPAIIQTLTPELYQSKMDSILKNFELAKKYMHPEKLIEEFLSKNV
jgi:hypothetical protein